METSGPNQDILGLVNRVTDGIEGFREDAPHGDSKLVVHYDDLVPCHKAVAGDGVRPHAHSVALEEGPVGDPLLVVIWGSSEGEHVSSGTNCTPTLQQTPLPRASLFLHTDAHTRHTYTHSWRGDHRRLVTEQILTSAWKNSRYAAHKHR